MEIGKTTIDILTLIEKAGGRPSYTYIPKVIREEIHSIVIQPRVMKDEQGDIIRVELDVEVRNNEIKEAS